MVPTPLLPFDRSNLTKIGLELEQHCTETKRQNNDSSRTATREDAAPGRIAQLFIDKLLQVPRIAPIGSHQMGNSQGSLHSASTAAVNEHLDGRPTEGKLGPHSPLGGSYGLDAAHPRGTTAGLRHHR